MGIVVYPATERRLDCACTKRGRFFLSTNDENNKLSGWLKGLSRDASGAFACLHDQRLLNTTTDWRQLR